MKVQTRRATPDESGDTLIELLFTVVIISIAASALLGALMTSIAGSTQHRELSVDDTLLKSIVETAKNQIQTTSANLPGTPLFSDCASSYTITYTWPSNLTNYSIISGGSYAAGKLTLNSITYWNPSPVSDFTSSCASEGIEKVAFTVKGPDRVPQSISFVVRSPNS